VYDDYYSPHAKASLERPIALTGFFGAGVEGVAHALAARTGLPWHSVDRTIEHTAGKSVAKLVLSEGEGRYLALERQALARVLADRPYGIVALSPNTLMDDENLRLALDKSTVVYLRGDLPTLLIRAMEQVATNAARYWPWFTETTHCMSEVGPLFEARRPGYERAHHTIPLHDLSHASPNRIALDLATRFGLDG
jgi:shikimate kinase